MWPIAQVCERTGLSPRTVRYYEEIGLLPGVRRSEGGRRVYGPDELERLGFISRLKALGLSLSEIGELNAVYAIALDDTGDSLTSEPPPVAERSQPGDVLAELPVQGSDGGAVEMVVVVMGEQYDVDRR